MPGSSLFALELGAVTWATAALALVGIGLLLGLQLVPATAVTARRLWPALASTLIYLLAVAGLFWMNGLALQLGIVAMTARVSWEAGVVVGGKRRAALIAAASAGASGVAVLAGPEPTVLVVLPAILAALAVRLFIRSRFAWLAEIGAFPLLPLLIVAAGAAERRFAAAMLLMLLLVETFDSYALLGGKLGGRRKAFPVLSPGKTVEGLAAGAAALAVTAAIAGTAIFGATVWASLGVAALAGTLAVAGDLAASRIKRGAGVKDYPVLAKSQGGLFDMMDGWLMAAAVTVALVVVSGR